MSITSHRPLTRLGRSAAVLAACLFAAVLTFAGAPVAQAAPSPDLVPSPSTVSSGGQVTLKVTGFLPGDTLEFTVDGTIPLDTAPVNGDAVVADANGRYEGVAAVPTGLTPGSHSITVAHEGAIRYGALASIDVVAQPISAVSPSSLPLTSYLADGVTATFEGFAPGAAVVLLVSNSLGGQVEPEAIADASGTVVFHFVPKSGSRFANVDTYNLLAYTPDSAVVSEPVLFSVTADTPTRTSPSAAAPVAGPATLAAAPAPVASPATPVKRAATFTG